MKIFFKFLKFLFLNILILLVLGFIITHCNKFRLNVDKATIYLTNNCEDKSRCWCAEYVMEAFWAGGKPIYLLPAFGYTYMLNTIGFEEISPKNYIPKKGDVIVFPPLKQNIWGHIQMYNGTIWMSDCPQNHLIPSKLYKNKKYRIFRSL